MGEGCRGLPTGVGHKQTLGVGPEELSAVFERTGSLTGAWGLQIRLG